MRVFFENDRYRVSETDGMVEVCVRREGDTTQSLTIQVSTEDLIPPQALGIFDMLPKLCSVSFYFSKKLYMYSYSW